LKEDEVLCLFSGAETLKWGIDEAQILSTNNQIAFNQGHNKTTFSII
jgi:hypothetical protein